MSSKQCLETICESASSDHYAVLQMGRLGLLIPQHQVHTLEPSIDVQRMQGEGFGWLTLAGVRSPVYCLSEDLRSITEVPPDRHICVLLITHENKFGLLCTQVALFEPFELDIVPVPECMRMTNLPLRGLVIHGDRLLYLSSAQQLLDCLDPNMRSVNADSSLSVG